MGLLEQEITELRTMLKQYDAGKLSNDQINTKIAIYSQVEKRTRLMLQAFTIAAKHKKPSLQRMIRANIIGDGTAIDTVGGDPETEKVKCPGKDFELIERRECLDLAGDESFPECNGCDERAATCRALLPGRH